jgi:hypothetical protein
LTGTFLALEHLRSEQPRLDIVPGISVATRQNNLNFPAIMTTPLIWRGFCSLWLFWKYILRNKATFADILKNGKIIKNEHYK